MGAVGEPWGVPAPRVTHGVEALTDGLSFVAAESSGERHGRRDGLLTVDLSGKQGGDDNRELFLGCVLGLGHVTNVGQDGAAVKRYRHVR